MRWLAALLLFGFPVMAADPSADSTSARKVYVLPIRDEIDTPMVYLVRRGVKEAMEAKADLLVVDMKTPGGSVGSTEEIVEILGRFRGETVTYVNNRAFSAGAIIAVGTRRIFMAPQSVIGAAAPIMLSPGGDGVQNLPNTFERKMVSALTALARTTSEKYGHDTDIIEAMIDKDKELVRVEHVTQSDGSTRAVTNVLNPKGSILTLTDRQAAKAYGDPPKPLLSAGTFETLDALLAHLGYANATRHSIQPSGAERVAVWLTAIGPLLLMIGVVGIYLEFKTPGFGLPGIVGIIAFLLYFVRGYVAGLSGLEWILVFILGLVLVGVELFVYPGTIALGLAGAALMLAAIIMAGVDTYPGMPALPTLPQMQLPVRDLAYATAGVIVALVVLSRFLPRTSFYRAVVSQSASGVKSEVALEMERATLQGREGVALSPLRPGGKAQFGDTILDVVSQGELVPPGARVRIIGYSGREAIVEVLPA